MGSQAISQVTEPSEYRSPLGQPRRVGVIPGNEDASFNNVQERVFVAIVMVARECCNHRFSVELAKHEYGRGKRDACPAILRLRDDRCGRQIVKLAGNRIPRAFV